MISPRRGVSSSFILSSSYSSSNGIALRFEYEDEYEDEYELAYPVWARVALFFDDTRSTNPDSSCATPTVYRRSIVSVHRFWVQRSGLLFLPYLRVVELKTCPPYYLGRRENLEGAILSGGFAVNPGRRAGALSLRAQP